MFILFSGSLKPVIQFGGASRQKSDESFLLSRMTRVRARLFEASMRPLGSVRERVLTS
jgi:hypothetical protein